MHESIDLESFAVGPCHKFTTVQKPFDSFRFGSIEQEIIAEHHTPSIVVIFDGDTLQLCIVYDVHLLLSFLCVDCTEMIRTCQPYNTFRILPSKRRSRRSSRKTYRSAHHRSWSPSTGDEPASIHTQRSRRACHATATTPSRYCKREPHHPKSSNANRRTSSTSFTLSFYLYIDILQ